MQKLVFYFFLFLSLSGVAKPQIQSEIYIFKTVPETLQWFAKVEEVLGPKDRRGLFLRIYHEVTLEMLNLFQEKAFNNPEWTQRLMLRYLSFYRNAYECYQTKACPVSAAWTRAFNENAGATYSPGIQLLLAISAHVNRDLPIVLAQLGTDFKSEELLSDFRKISSIFSRRMPRLRGVLNLYQRCPMYEWEKKFVLDETMWAMGRTRERSWKNGEKLSQTRTLQREVALINEIEHYTRMQDLEIVIVSPIPQKLLCL